ncbi:MAG: fibronectin type III domain-containing protein, partial [Bacteroidetes bacterium]|nr:fibronectin type III domain-containing protein [Bacteroidota bacterium]
PVSSSGNSLTLNGLSAGNNYEWQVRSVCSGSNSAWSNGVFFTTLPSGPAPCNIPSGLSTSQLSQTSAQLNWNNVSGAISYDIQYREQGSATWIGPFNTGNNTYSLTSLTPNTSYEWQVKTICTDTTSDWSSTQIFTTPDNSGSGSCDPLTGWNTLDIGSTGSPGMACDSVGIVKLSGSGEKIGSTADGFYFVYQSLPADGEITARILSFAGTDNGAQGGLMIREGLDPGSRHGSMLFVQDNSLDFKRRASTNGSSNANSTSATAPIWVRLTRIGEKIRGYYSSDGNNWIQLGPAPSVAVGSVFIGLVVSNSDNSGTASAQLDNVSLTGTSSPPSCDTPTGLSASSITETSAQLTWQAVSGVSSYEVQYRLNGAGTWTGP